MLCYLLLSQNENAEEQFEIDESRLKRISLVVDIKIRHSTLDFPPNQQLEVASFDIVLHELSQYINTSSSTGDFILIRIRIKMRSLKVLTLVCLLGLLGCVFGHYVEPRIDYNAPTFSDSIEGRIVGGSPAKKGQFPHQVSLHWEFTGSIFYCGGTIINSRWILTAAHCMVDLPEFGIIVVKAGKYQLGVDEDTEQSIEVEKNITHKSYAGGVNPYDIALLKLKKPLTLSKAVAAIRLPEAGEELTGTVVLSGWGSISSTKQPVWPEKLQKIDLSVIDFQTCKEALGKFNLSSSLHETNVCTGPLTGGLSACNGDSGGPLITIKSNNETELVGIVSWGITPCGTPGAPSIYTKVSSYIDWIRDSIAANMLAVKFLIRLIITYDDVVCCNAKLQLPTVSLKSSYYNRALQFIGLKRVIFTPISVIELSSIRIRKKMQSLKLITPLPSSWKCTWALWLQSTNIINFIEESAEGVSTPKIEQFSYQISLQTKGINGAHFCGGAIISPEWILTAGACVIDNSQPEKLIVVAGVNKFHIIVDTLQEVEVAKIIMNKGYVGGRSADNIALLKLKKPFSITTSVSTISLPAAGAEYNGTVVLSGWGLIPNDVPEYSKKLQTTKLQIIDYNTCRKLLRKFGINTLLKETNICTDTSTVEIACIGDSGGPLTVIKSNGEVELVGIVSWGIEPCGTKGAPSIFTKVSSYIDWIQKTIADN
ncbi:transmembrane protease serine 9-like [Prorops nasuta]|uniref:transmembrane protease serine 9-like n=1 Tax=Prorops nasuta TaxID=863751 RepID=UPI0034CF4E45